MKFFIALALTLMALGSFAEKTKGRKSYILPSNLKLRQRDIEQLLQNKNGYEHETEGVDDNIESEPMDMVPSNMALKPDTSSGRLFFKKFFLLGKNTPSQPQFFIITQPARPTNPIDTDPSTEIDISFTGTASATPLDARGENLSDDYITDDDDDVYEDEIANENINTKKDRHTTYKLVKGKGNQKGLSFVVPSKYMRDFQNKQNSVVVNPSATYNSGSNKAKKVLVSNNSNGNGKRKRSRKPVRRFIVSQN